MFYDCKPIQEVQQELGGTILKTSSVTNRKDFGDLCTKLNSSKKIYIFQVNYGWVRVRKETMIKNRTIPSSCSVYKHDYQVNKLRDLNPNVFNSIKIVSRISKAAERVKYETKFGLCRITFDALIQGSGLTIKSAVNPLKYFENMLYEKSQAYRDGLYHLVGGYNGVDNMMTIRGEFGLCQITAYQLLYGCKLSIESALCKTSYVRNKLNKKFGYNFTYEKLKYTAAKNKVIVRCTKHDHYYEVKYNKFQTISQLSGCPLCGEEGKNDHTFSSWKLSGPDNYATLYFLRFYNEDTEFVKIGITSGKIRQRYTKGARAGFSYEILHQYTTTDRRFIWDTEKLFIKNYRDFKIPINYFPGCAHEAFDISQKKVIFDELKNITDEHFRLSEGNQ